MLVARVVSLSVDRTKPKWGEGGNDAVKNTNTNEIQILFAGYEKPAKLGKMLYKKTLSFLSLELAPSPPLRQSIKANA